MAKTANAYTPDQGEVAITISAANVAAIAAFSTADEIVIDGAVRSFKQVTAPSRTREETKVAGDSTPITTASVTGASHLVAAAGRPDIDRAKRLSQT